MLTHYLIFLIAGTSNRASMGDITSRISAGYAMANAPHLNPSSYFRTGRNDSVSFTLNVALKFR